MNSPVQLAEKLEEFEDFKRTLKQKSSGPNVKKQEFRFTEKNRRYESPGKFDKKFPASTNYNKHYEAPVTKYESVQRYQDSAQKGDSCRVDDFRDAMSGSRSSPSRNDDESRVKRTDEQDPRTTDYYQHLHTSAFGAAIAGNNSRTRVLEGTSGDSPFLPEPLQLSCQVIYSQFGLAIHQNDHQARRRFVKWAQNEMAVVPDFHKRILFSDEAHFWLNGYVNKQNCRIWREANPQVYVETSKKTPFILIFNVGIQKKYFMKKTAVNHDAVDKGLMRISIDDEWQSMVSIA
ncbi:hypothetical protein TNCV_2582071 [Trichonephila clavipes]|nr:hypothetical protein TNCV_2582071 [Trichonephila clavipes]